MLILIVEDDPLVALDLEDIVRENATADVIICGSIESATPMLAEPVEFAFFDIDLRDGDSLGLASALQRRNVPFAFVSGSRRQDLPTHLQAAPFVAKPYVASDIARLTRAAWSRQAGSKQAA